MEFDRNCPIAAKVSQAGDLITGLELRIRGLEDVLDNPELPEERRRHIENELIDIKDILDKNRDILKGLHKENSKTYLVTASILFIVFFLYAAYLILYDISQGNSKNK